MSYNVERCFKILGSIGIEVIVGIIKDLFNKI